MEGKRIRGGSPEWYWGVVIRDKWMDTGQQNASTRSRGVWTSWLTCTPSPGAPGVDQELVVLHSVGKYLNQWFIRASEYMKLKSQARKWLKESMGVACANVCPELVCKVCSPSSPSKIWVRLYVPKIQFYKGLVSSKLLQKVRDRRGGSGKAVMTYYQASQVIAKNYSKLKNKRVTRRMWHIFSENIFSPIRSNLKRYLYIME